MKKIFILLIFSILAFGKIEILDRLNLNGDYFRGFNFSELSDLAFDKKTKTLYMVSDKGILFSFYANFDDDKIHLKPLSANYLSKNGKRLKKWKRDSEGLTIDEKGRLYISFEGKPRVYRVSKDGELLKKIKFKLFKKYKQRSRNKGLEALAYSPKYGFLTAFEYAPKGFKKCNQIIFSNKGRVWHVALEPIKNCAITAMEFIDSDNILILERAYGGIFREFAVTLKRFNLKSKESKVLWQIDTNREDIVENFEGLARVGKNRFLMISDDNDSFFAHTILILFKIKD